MESSLTQVTQTLGVRVDGVKVDTCLSAVIRLVKERDESIHARLALNRNGGGGRSRSWPSHHRKRPQNEGYAIHQGPGRTLSKHANGPSGLRHNCPRRS